MNADYHGNNFTDIEFLDPVQDHLLTDLSKFPAIWELDPKKQEVDLDIYYEASRAIPIDYDHTTNEQLVPIGSWFMIGTSGPYYVTAWNDDVMTFSPSATVATQLEVTRLVFTLA